jgi:hypothetical protein
MYPVHEGLDGFQGVPLDAVALRRVMAHFLRSGDG